MKKKQKNNLNIKDLKENEHFNVEINNKIIEKINKIDDKSDLKDHIELSKNFLKNYFK